MLARLTLLVDNRLVVIAGLFVAAWLVSRGSGAVARRVLAWHDRRHLANDPGETGKLVDIKRRETLVALIRTGIGYAGFAAAMVLAIAELIGGVDPPAAVAGAGFFLVPCRLARPSGFQDRPIRPLWHPAFGHLLSQ